MQAACDSIAAEGYEAYGYRLSSLTGSYIETGRHMIANAPALNDLIPSLRLSGRRWCVTCRAKGRAR